MSNQQNPQPKRGAVSEPGNELAARQPNVLPVPLDGPLNDLDQAYRLARVFAQADIVPSDLRNKPANVFLVVLYGQRLGIPPEIAISSISVVKGRPRMSGQLLLAKVREAGHLPKIVHGRGQCTVTITRGDTGEVHSETFTLDDAVTAGLCSIKNGKPYARSKQGEPLPWESYPKRMLQWRAVSTCVDILCPEVKMGFVVEDEVDELPADRPSLAQVAAERMDQTPPAAQPDPQPGPSEEDKQAALEAELAELAAEHTGDTPAAAPEDQTPRPAPDYVCDVCGAEGEHFQDECPDLKHPAEEVGR